MVRISERTDPHIQAMSRYQATEHMIVAAIKYSVFISYFAVYGLHWERTTSLSDTRVFREPSTSPTISMNGNRKPSNDRHNDPGVNLPYPVNPNVNGVSWSPQSPIFPPFPPSNGWPHHHQQHQSQPPTPISTNGMAVGPPLQVQQTPQFTNNLASMLPANILQEVFRMSVPVGNSQNDDDLLVKALKASTERGQTYKQAIETLHGVWIHVHYRSMSTNIHLSGQ